MALAMWGAVALGASLAAQSLDRILAVVAGDVILVSDVRAFVDLGLFDVEDVPADQQAWALDRLIERRLALDEVDRYRVPVPPPASIDRALTQVQNRFPTTAAFETALATVGLEHADLRQILEDDARLEAYLGERFGTANRLSDLELEDYFEEHRDQFGARSGDDAFEAVRDEVRTRLWAERRASLVNDWMAGLVRRGDVTRFEP